MGRLDWLSERQTGLGGTDAAAIAGVGFRDAAEVYAEKVSPHPIDREPSERMRHGLWNEPYVASEYERLTGYELVPHTAPFVVRHPGEPWRLCSPDRLTAASPLLVELKSVYGPPGDAWGEPGTDQIPDGYLIQVQHALDVCLAAGLVEQDAAEVCVNFVGYETRLYLVRWNADLVRPLVELEREFWGRVERREPVGPDWSHPLRDQVANRLALIRPDTAVALGPDAIALADEYQRLAAEARRLDAMSRDFKGQLGILLGQAEEGRLPDGRRVRQKVCHRKGYTVEPSQYVDFRILKPRKGGRPSDE